MKQKVTFNIDTENVELLEAVWLELRSKYKAKQLNKSAIIEAMIVYLSDELQHDGCNSSYVETLMKDYLNG